MGRKTGPFHSRSAPDLSERRPSRARKPFGKSVRWREARGEEVGGEENDNNNKKKKKDILPTRRGRILKMPRTAGQGGRKSERGQMGSPCIEARRGATCEEARMYVNMGRRWEKDGESHGN